MDKYFYHEFLPPTMNLTESDWEILELCKRHRETRKNLATALDLSPNHVSRELTKLRENGLLTQPGPADNSGMYTTTIKGDFALEKRDMYQTGRSNLFLELLDSTMTLVDDLSSETDIIIEPDDIVLTEIQAYDLLHTLEDVGKITPSRAAELSGQNQTITRALLYELDFYGLLTSTPTSKGIIYDITPRGRRLLDDNPQNTVKNINRQWNNIPTIRDEDPQSNH